MSEAKLPMAGGGGHDEPVGADPGGSSGGPPPPVSRPRASSSRLIGTLAVAGAIAGFFIVLVYQWSRPRIEAHQAEVLRAAIHEVLAAPQSTRTFFLVDGAFTDVPGESVDTADVDRVYVGFDGTGAPVGVAVAAGEPGFQDMISLLFGYDPATHQVLGMKVLDSKETPGLGDRIEKDSVFGAEFRGVATPLARVKEARATGAENEVITITGATISSTAVVNIINHRLEAVGGQLDRLWQVGVPARAAGSGPASAGDAPSGVGRGGGA